MKKTSQILILIFLLIFILHSCKKDEDNNNPDPPVVKSKHAWVVGSHDDSTQYAYIGYSSDGGETWTRQAENDNDILNVFLGDVWAIDKNIVWAVGSGNTIIKTSDGGQTWDKVQGPSKYMDANLESIHILGEEDIWISGAPSVVYNSKDGGNTWAIYDSTVFGSNIQLQGIHAVSPDIIYTVGQITNSTSDYDGYISRTLDAGNTWNTIVPDTNFGWIRVTSSDPYNIIVYGGASKYLLSTDAGATWKNKIVPHAGGGGTGGADINCLIMLDQQSWWGAFDLNNIFKTTNSGTSWTKQPAPGETDMWLLGIDAYSNDWALVVGAATHTYNGKVVKTTDGGASWNVVLANTSMLQKVCFAKN